MERLVSAADRQAIHDFLLELETDLGNAIGDPFELLLSQEAGVAASKDMASLPDVLEVLGKSLVVSDLADDVAAAWEEGRDAFESLRSHMRPESTSTELDDVLPQYGLTGAQLRAKIAAYKYFRQLPQPPDPRKLEAKAVAPRSERRKQQITNWVKRLLDRFRHALAAANVLLGSIGQLGIPAADVVRELKELTEVSLRAR